MFLCSDVFLLYADWSGDGAIGHLLSLCSRTDNYASIGMMFRLTVVIFVNRVSPSAVCDSCSQRTIHVKRFHFYQALIIFDILFHFVRKFEKVHPG